MEKDYLKKVVTCIFATPMPLKFKIEELPDEQKPDSHTLQGLYSGTPMILCVSHLMKIIT